MSAVSAESGSELRDLAARVQYAAFIGDLPSLRQNLERLRRLNVDATVSSLKQVHEAYGEWKLAESLATTDKNAAADAAKRCVDLTAKTQKEMFTADRLALESICLDLLGELRIARSIFYQRKRDQSLATEAAAASTNPRVLMAQAFAARGYGRIEEFRANLSRAVEAFEKESPEPGRPDWGYAEALTALGELELEQGNALAARNVLEKVLVLVPEHRRARILLEQAAVR